MARVAVAHTRFELPGGVVLQRNTDTVATGLTFLGGSIDARTSAVAAALGAHVLTREGEIDNRTSEQWAMLLNLDERDFVQYRTGAGRLTADLALMLERMVVRGRLPLADGSAVDVGSVRESIPRVIRRATGCTVLVRRASVESLFAFPGRREFLYVLHNPARREAAGGGGHELSGRVSAGIGSFSMEGLHFGGRGFQLEQYEIEFPARVGPEGSSIDRRHAPHGDRRRLPHGAATRRIVEMELSGR
jgi:hypothetical protein